MTAYDASAESRVRRALASTSGNRDALEAANAMLAALNVHGGYEGADILVKAVAAQAPSLQSSAGAPHAGNSPTGPADAEAASALAHRVRGVDPRTVEAAKAAEATAAHDAEGLSGANTGDEAAQAPSPIAEDTGLAAHASVRSGGAGFHDDALATLDVSAPANPLQTGRLYGDGGDNTLTSGEGLVRLFGGKGDDVLVSNGDGDRLSGGGGADTFVFSAFESSRVGVIDGLGKGDVIDLSMVAVQFGLDHFTATTAFDGHAGEVTAAYDAVRDRTVFRFDTDGDGHADHRLVVDHGDYSDFSFFLDVDRSGLVV